MENYIVKVLAADYVTHNVRRFVVEKPAGYTYIPGQATDVSINRPGLEQELRPFTFTSLPDADHLEFIIKIYKGHDGMTEKLASIEPGDELILHEVFGAIEYRGPGVFIAGGAGITPFIAIMRSIHQTGHLAQCSLLFANHTPEDIILKDELNEMMGANYTDIIRLPSSGAQEKFIDKELIAKCTGSPDQFYYICGPDQFTADMINILNEHGIQNDKIVIEQ